MIAAVPETLLNNLGRDLSSKQRGGVRVPWLADRDSREPGGVGDFLDEFGSLVLSPLDFSFADPCSERDRVSV